jgi:lysophospholipid acyltransferase (LPLAT)-like uncharacterized protein
LKNIRLNILALLATGLLRLLRFTWRVRVVYDAPLPTKRRMVFCFWHGRQAALLAYRQSVPIVVLSSLSADGTLQANILSRLGYGVCRGSSSRSGAAGLKSMVRRIRGGCDAAFAVDGPRGPIRVAKGGAIIAASCGGALVVPVAARAGSAWVFRNTWDQYALPKPFARITVRIGKPQTPDTLNASRLTDLIQSLHGDGVT